MPGAVAVATAAAHPAGEAHIAGEAADREPVEKHMHAVLVDAPAADFEPAAEFFADALHRVGGVGADFRIGHATAIARLRVRKSRFDSAATLSSSSVS